MSKIANCEDTFKCVFPDHEYQDLKIEEANMINFTMYYIAKFYNDRIGQLFDYNEILCYPFAKEMCIKETYVSFIENCTEEEHYHIVEQKIESIFQKLKEYIFNYIGKHDISINIPCEKINNEIVAMSNGYFRNALEAHYLSVYGYRNTLAYPMESLMYLMGLPELLDDENVEGRRDKYAIKLLAHIAEKLYLFILAEVKRIIESKGIIDLNIKPVDNLEIPVQQLVEKVNGPILPQQLVQPYTQISPQQLVEWNDAFTPVDVEQIISQFPILQIIQQAQEESAASSEINSDLINAYNSLDTYNKTIVNSFTQIILKNENSVS